MLNLGYFQWLTASSDGSVTGVVYDFMLMNYINVCLRIKDVSCAVSENNSSAVTEMGDLLATIDMGRKVGGCCAPFLRELGTNLTRCRLG